MTRRKTDFASCSAGEKDFSEFRRALVQKEQAASHPGGRPEWLCRREGFCQNPTSTRAGKFGGRQMTDRPHVSLSADVLPAGRASLGAAPPEGTQNLGVSCWKCRPGSRRPESGCRESRGGIRGRSARNHIGTSPAPYTKSHRNRLPALHEMESEFGRSLHETTSESRRCFARNHIGIPGLPRTKSSRNPPGTLHETASEFPLFRRSGVSVRADGGIPGPAAPLRPTEGPHFYGRDCPAENVKGQPLLGFPGRSGACLGIVCPAGAGFRRPEGRKIPCLPGMGPGGLG